MKSISYFLVWQKRKLSDKPVEAEEDYTKFNSADFARKVSVRRAACTAQMLVLLVETEAFSKFCDTMVRADVLLIFVHLCLCTAFLSFVEQKRGKNKGISCENCSIFIMFKFIVRHTLPAASGQGHRLMFSFFFFFFF